MDRRKLIATIVERTGTKLDADDPAFLLVELNELVFDEQVAEVAKKLSGAADRFGEITTRNVDGFVAVANEALAKFIQRTGELKAAVESISAAQRRPESPARPPSGVSITKEIYNPILWWLVPMAFVIGILVGVVLPLLVAKVP